MTGKLRESRKKAGKCFMHKESFSRQAHEGCRRPPVPEGSEPSTPGPQGLAGPYLLVAVVCSLLLDTVSELRARILGVVPCSCT